MNQTKQIPGLRLITTVALLFGAMTIVSGGSVLFGPAGIKMTAGQVVNFVLWFNFLAGFLYVLAGFAIWQHKSWAANLSAVIALMTALVFIALGLHMVGGGQYEMRTLAAMTLRLGLWIFIYFYLRRVLGAQSGIKIN